MKTVQIKRISQTLAGLFLATMLQVGAQPAATEPANAPAELDRAERQPVVRTYDKFPDPSGNEQDFNARTYYDEPDPNGRENMDYERYPENVDSMKGDESDTQYIRYDEENEANDDSRYRGSNPDAWVPNEKQE